jgi:hypothetical protein
MEIMQVFYDYVVANKVSGEVFVLGSCIGLGVENASVENF